MCLFVSRRLNKNKTGQGLVGSLVGTIDQISWDLLVSHGHEIGYDMHRTVSFPPYQLDIKLFLLIFFCKKYDGVLPTLENYRIHFIFL